MITIIYGPPGYGKTSLMAHLLSEEAFNQDRLFLQRERIEELRAGGFPVSVPHTCICSSFDMMARKFGFSPIPAIKINPYKIGFFNENVQTHFIAPFSMIGIDEAQRYFNSRMSRFYPDWQSRFYEAHRHNGYDFYLATQRPMLIDVNIRELSEFLEVVGLKVYNDRQFDCSRKAVWTVRKIACSAEWDLYMNSGKREKVYKEYKIVADYDVFSLYNSFALAPRFFEGHFDEDFFRVFTLQPEVTVEDYENFCSRYDEEVPAGFYLTMKKGDKNND